jgi:hypothetical protein
MAVFKLDSGNLAATVQDAATLAFPFIDPVAENMAEGVRFFRCCFVAQPHDTRFYKRV